MSEASIPVSPKAPGDPGDSFDDLAEANFPPEERSAKIQEQLTAGFNGEQPDILFSFSGGIRKFPSGRYRSLAYSEADLSEHGLATGGRTRVIAAAEIAKTMPDLKLVTTSSNRFDPEEPSMASVTKGELVRRGVASQLIDTEESSFNTTTQLTEMINLAMSNGWQKVAALTNEYHLPRLSYMYEHLATIVDDVDFQATLKKFQDTGGKVEFVCAEPILRLMSSHFRTYLKAVEETDGFKKTVEAEQQGLNDLKAGNYQVALKPENSRPN